MHAVPHFKIKVDSTMRNHPSRLFPITGNQFQIFLPLNGKTIEVVSLNFLTALVGVLSQLLSAKHGSRMSVPFSPGSPHQPAPHRKESSSFFPSVILSSAKRFHLK
jgi:hypothetical protein